MSRTNVVYRLTQAAYCDWLAMPPVNETLLGRLPPEDRPVVVQEATQDLDPASWRWEAWALLIGTRAVRRSSD